MIIGYVMVMVPMMPTQIIDPFKNNDARPIPRATYSILCRFTSIVVSGRTAWWVRDDLILL